MAKRRNPAAASLVTADDEEVATSNRLPVDAVLGAGTAFGGKVQLSDGTDNHDILSDGAAMVGHGKTLKSVTGSVSTDTDIVSAVASKRIKVYRISLLVISTTLVTVTMQSNASTAKATYPLQGPASVTVGIAESVDPPAFLFATTAGEKLTLDVSAAVTVYYNVSYWDDDAT